MRLATGLVLLVDALDGDLDGAGAGLDCVLACFELELLDPFDNQSSNPPEIGLFRFFSVFPLLLLLLFKIFDAISGSPFD